MHKMGFAVSASMSIIATQAMAHVSAQSNEPRHVPAIEGISPQVEAAIQSALSKKDARDAISEIMPLMLDGWQKDGQSLRDMIQLAQTRDHTWNPGNSAPHNPGVSVCYTNCYFACHGSRGWR